MRSEPTMRGVEKMYESIRTRLASTDFAGLAEELVTARMRKVNIAYEIAKDAHSLQERDGGERYFEHIREVTNILLNEFPSPTLREVLGAILHDTDEDTYLEHETILNLFGPEIADDNDHLTKQSLEHYLTAQQSVVYDGLEPEEQQLYLQEIKPQLKLQRTQQYFAKLRASGSDFAVRIKAADRLHNLRSLVELQDPQRIYDQIKQTETYLLPTLEERGMTTESALITRQIRHLKKAYVDMTSKEGVRVTII